LFCEDEKDYGFGAMNEQYGDWFEVIGT